MRLRWTSSAANDLYKIAQRIQRIQEDNPEAATRVAKTLYEGCASLSDFPRRGRNGRIEGTRELVFPGLPYIVVYQIKDQIVEVVRFITVRKTGHKREHALIGSRTREPCPCV